MRNKFKHQSDNKLTREEKSRLEAISSKGKRGKEVSRLILKSSVVVKREQAIKQVQLNVWVAPWSSVYKLYTLPPFAEALYLV